MDLVMGIFVYFLVWWTSLFMVLPIGVERDTQPEKGMDAGAPKHARMKQKLKLNTLVAAGVWLVIYVLLEIFGVELAEYFRNAAR
ncbi:MAG: DUF1467 family protein [Pseudomonadota bacterium]